MLRSKYAKPDVPTFVKMEFEYRNKKYVIERNPEYERPKIHGEGTTTQSANATLIYPDKDTPVTGSSNVTVAINELIGLDYEQFTQIAMIAQNRQSSLCGYRYQNRISRRSLRQVFG